ncbi:hypothetical protein KM043_005889 [Ampulex compressa]|nr:hypothetical protein KM043_005889 [Ampulex compressa]
MEKLADSLEAHEKHKEPRTHDSLLPRECDAKRHSVSMDRDGDADKDSDSEGPASASSQLRLESARHFEALDKRPGREGGATLKGANDSGSNYRGAKSRGVSQGEGKSVRDKLERACE